MAVAFSLDIASSPKTAAALALATSARTASTIGLGRRLGRCGVMGLDSERSIAYRRSAAAHLLRIAPFGLVVVADQVQRAVDDVQQQFVGSGVQPNAAAERTAVSALTITSPSRPRSSRSSTKLSTSVG